VQRVFYFAESGCSLISYSAIFRKFLNIGWKLGQGKKVDFKDKKFDLEVENLTKKVDKKSIRVEKVDYFLPLSDK